MIIKYDNKAIKYTNKWISVDSQPTPPTIYQIYTSGTNGSVAALPTSGISGTEVTLSNTPDTGYQFDSYSITGATLKNTNQFDIGNSDVYVHGNFTAIPVEYVQIGNLLWQTVNTNISVSSGSVSREAGRYGVQRYYNTTGVSILSSQLTDGWRVPTYNDFQALTSAVSNNASALCATSPVWSGTNTSGFTGLPTGFYWSETESVEGVGTLAQFYGTNGYLYGFDTSNISLQSGGSTGIYCTVRLCKNAT